MSLRWWFLLCLLLAACAHGPSAVRPGVLVVENGVLVDGLGGPPVPRARVVMRGGLVAAAGSMDRVPAPAGAEVLDAEGGTILPGLVDAHVHGVADPAVRRSLLESGVTLVCNVGAPWSDLPGLRQDTWNGLPVARAVYAGPVLTPPGGYPGPVHGRAYALEASGAAGVEAAVERLHAAGATMLKLAFEPGREGSCDPGRALPVFAPDEARAAVARAHALGMTVRAHVEDAAMLDRALDAGVDVVEHAPVRRCGSGPDLEPLLRRMVARGVILTPTLGAGVRSTWDNGPLLGLVGRYAALGGAVATGTDAPFAGLRHGPPLEEMELLSRAGLAPMEVLLAGTAVAARACGRIGQGRIAPGMAADLIVVPGDPLADPGVLARPRWVVLGGVVAKHGD